MRIISGKYRGHQLVSFKADHIRPTTDRVKESLFNSLNGYFEEARVLDLFSGTGNLGLESLSRGSVHVHFVDNHQRSIDILKQNIQKLRVESKDYKIDKKDCLAWVKSYSGEPFDIIFIDPPFTKKMAHDVMTALSETALCKEDTVIAIESTIHERIEDQYGSLNRFKAKSFGDKILSMYQVQDEEEGRLSR